MLYRVVAATNPQDKSVKYYARAVHFDETVSLEKLAEHMSNHNTPYSPGIIKGVLTDMVGCIRELVLEGKSVKLPDLAIFSCSIISEGAATAEEFSVKGNVKGFRLASRATGSFRSSEIDGKVTLKNVNEIVQTTGTTSEP